MTFSIYAVVAALLIAIGVHGVTSREHLVRKIVALNVIGGGVFLFLIAVAFRRGPGEADPVPQALVLTGIVVAVSVTAFAVAIVRRIHAVDGRSSLDEKADLE